MANFRAPDSDANVDLRGASARDLYETGVALARALGGQAAPQPETDLAAPQTARRSTLIDLTKRIEQWIVQPPDYDGDWTQRSRRRQRTR